MKATNTLPIADTRVEFTPPEPLPLSAHIATLAAVLLPFFGLVASAVLLWGWGLTWVELVLFAGMYLLTALGITVGYHRLFTHHSFETNPVVKCVLGIFGAMAVQGTLLRWVAFHRRHHQLSDQRDDPHSPHHHGKGILGILRGLWHAHMGWMFKGDPDLSHYVKDLRQSKFIRVLSRLFPVWVLLGLLIPTGLGYLLWGGWFGAMLGLVWGGLVRIFFVHHVTWSVNSICHLWGRRPFPCRDESRNNFVVGVLALGEGWHNNHHAFPTSARHGFRWWQIDLSYWVIRMFVLLGLAWNVKLPTKGAAAA
jgi:stearoyl-CoA desaturase (delta-9 desaturase)